ncbi:serine/threonine-protein kinase PLK1 isoform X2 [Harpegnathos saltator]|uniref:serine/threonine-protein kinase PLK1 isoform X2 n=1 Tax=Harpegnathos saltator TaxID=610380 RepID=UPI000DBEEEE7|nr:serine/threonine-protein kinase PLK1 isoform X2 [Harpegnathos saltator]
MLPPNMLDVHGFAGRDGSSRGLLSETMCAELRPDVTATSSTTCHLLEARAVARCHEEFDETIRTASEPECSKRRVESTTGGSTRSMDGRSPRQGFSKGSASLQSLVRRRSRRHVGGGSSLPLEAELSSRQAVYPADLVKDSLVNTAALVFRNADDDTRTATPTSTLIYATSSSAQPSTSRPDSNNVQDVSSSASNVVTSNGSNATSTTTTSGSAAGRQFGNAAAVSLPRSAATGVATPGPSTSSWNNSVVEQESDYVVDPVQGNAYHKGHFLGKGGFARVYLMTDVNNGNQYACKIIPKNRMQKIHMQKIAREIMIHKELNHVNVVQMHHYFEDNLNVYMLLEACPRKSLMHVLKYRGKVTEPEARYYMKQMVTGVAYIHSQKVVHRDLKPGNMFLSDRMIVKIGDFGLATRPDGQRRTICGTPNYIAPEVLYKQAYSYEADVWALGCILYALLVGQPPFDTATLKETYARICNNHYREVDDSIASRSGQDLIRWLLQSNPELRPSLERVKEHAYLTKEYVPVSLPHTCCYQMPPTSIIEPSSVSTVARSQQEPNKAQQVWQQSLVHPDASGMPRYQQQSMQTQQQQPQQQQQFQQQHLLNRSQKSLQKESKVSSWLVRKLPKLPRFRQRLSSVLCPDHKKIGLVAQSVQMHRALEACVTEMKRNNTCNPPTVEDIVPLFVTKWIDYSNKYGLGFQLSDKSVGVLFNDNTKISYTHDRRRVEYMTTDDEVTRYHREKDIPLALQKKLELLRHFTEYMDDFLTEGGELKKYRAPPRQSKNACVPRMRRWLRTDKAIVMELTVPLLQVNFFVDHTKMVVSQESPGRGYLITYIDTGRHASSYWLNDLRDLGCTPDLYERLYYVCKVTREFAELDNNTIA